MAKKTIFAEILELILGWKLKDAGEKLDQNLTSLSTTDLTKLRQLLDQYRGYQIDFSEAVARLDDDPEQSEFILNQIPDNVRVTHPEYQVLMRNIQAFRDHAALKRAEELVEKAAEHIKIEFNPSLAEEEIESAKQVYPNWDQVASLRLKIQGTSDLTARFSKGLSIQKEVSALREKGGLTSYQKAMRLINEYASLGLEKLGIILFDAELEREDLLKMITRAEGESWTHRLNEEDQDAEEILKLEQSIRSLEDAETKNVRVLYNNNARLMNLLLAEVGSLDLQSERAIQADKRIGELREKNVRLKEEATQDVATRALEYYGLAQKAFDLGEFSTAETDLRLALEAGTSESTYADGEYLGNIDPPEAMIKKIENLIEKINEAKARRRKYTERLNELRRLYRNDRFETVNELENWLSELNVFYRMDSATPGLQDFRSELSDKIDRLRSFSFTLESEKIVRALDDGNYDEAEKGLETIQSLKGALSGADQSNVKKLLSRLENERKTAAAVQPKLAEAEAIYARSGESLRVSDEDAEAFAALRREIEALFASASLETSLKVRRQIEDQDAVLSFLREHRETLEAASEALRRGSIHETALTDLNELKDSVLAEFTAFKTLRKKANRLTLRKDDDPQHGVNGERNVTGGDMDSNLENETGEAQAASPEAKNSETNGNGAGFEIKTRTQRIFETLYSFDGSDSYAEAVDFIEKTLTAEEREDPAIKFEIDRISLANRMAQAKFYYSQAEEAFARFDYQDAEDFATLSLNEVNTINAAQLLSTIRSRKDGWERSLAEIDGFLEIEIDSSKPLPEETAEQVRNIAEQLKSFGSFEAFGSESKNRLQTVEARVKRLQNQEALDFANLMRRFETWVMTGEEGLKNAEEVLASVENRAWIQNRSQEIFEARVRLDEVSNTNQALDILIKQADHFIRIGDFRSAERILASFNAENRANWPDWLSIRLENGALRIQDQKAQYDAVLTQFTRDDSGVSPIIDSVREVLDPASQDGNAISKLLSRLTQMKNTLDKEITIDPELNPYPKQCAFLTDTVRWLLTIDDTIGNGSGKTGDVTQETVFSLRRTGRELLERLPNSLNSLQSSFDDRLRWLETRSHAAQLIASIKDSRRRGGKGDTARGTLSQELDALMSLPLIEREQRTVDEVKRERTRKQQFVIGLISIPVILLLILTGLYIMSPKLIQMLTPTATGTATMTATATATVTGTATVTPTITQTPTVTPTPTITLTATATPRPVGLSGQVKYKKVGVYELPSSASANLAAEYLSVGEEVEILRYCQPSGTGQIWLLIRYESATRNTGWVFAYTGEGSNIVSVDPYELTANEALAANPEYRMICPTSADEIMPEEPPAK